MKNKIRAWFSLCLAGLFLLIGVPLTLFSLAGFFDIIKGHLAGQVGISKDVLVFPLLVASVWLLKLARDSWIKFREFQQKDQPPLGWD